MVRETVRPKTRKEGRKDEGKRKEEDSAIMGREDELFPVDREKFRGERGGKRVDRAEAAMIAKFGGDHILPTFQPNARIAELYRAADTGA